MMEMYNGLISFFAQWFQYFKKSGVKVEVINPAPFHDKFVEGKVGELISTLKSELGKALEVTVKNPAQFSTKTLENRIGDLLVAVKDIPTPELGKVESLLKDLVSQVKAIPQPKTADIKIPAFPNSIEVKNFPKTQKIEGSVDVDFKKVIEGLQVVVDAINDLKVDMSHEMKGISTVYAGQTGSRSTLKISDGSDETVKVSVLDYTNSNPLAVRLTDTTGDYVGAGAGTQYTEDAVAAANPTGTAPILVRTDTPATQVTTDGDNIAQRGTNYGAGYVQVVTSAGAYVDTFGGGSQYTEDAVAAANPTGTAVNLVRQDTPAALVTTDGDNVTQRGTNYGAAYSQIVTSAGAFVDTFGGGTQYADGAVRGTATGTVAMGDDGTNIQSIKVDAAGELQVDVLTMPTVTVNSHAVTNAGTFAVQVDGAALTSLQLADDVVATLGTTTYTEATTKGTTIGAVRRDADTTLVDTTNEIGPLQMDANGRLKVEAFSGETLPVSLTSTTITGSVAVTNAGTFATQVDGAALTALQLIDDTVVAQGTALGTTKNSMIAGSVTTAAPTYVTGQISPLSLDTAGALRVSGAGGGTQYTEGDADATITGTAMLGEGTAGDILKTFSAVAAGDGGAARGMVAFGNGTGGYQPLKADINGALIISDSADNEIKILAAGADNVVNTENQLVTAAMLYAFDGATYDRVTNGGGTEATALRVTLANDSTGLVSVDDNAGSITVDQPTGTNLHTVVDSGTITTVSTVTALGAGTTGPMKAEDVAHATGDQGFAVWGVANQANTSFAADGDYVPLGTDVEGNVRAVGNRDHDAVDAGEVLSVGGVAVSGSASPTSVASGDRTRTIYNQHGIPYVMAGHPNLITREFDFGTAAQTDLNLATAVVAADERVYVTRFEATCDNANSVAVAVRAGFGTAAVPTASATGVSGMISSHPGLAAGSGIISGTGAGIIAVGGVGEEPRFTSSVATGGNLHVVISYYLIDETP